MQRTGSRDIPVSPTRWKTRMIRSPRRAPTSLAATLLAMAALVLTLGLAGCGGARHAPARGAHRPTTSTAAAATPTASAPTSTSTTAPAPVSDPVTFGLGDAPGHFARCLPADPHCCDMAAGTCDLAHMSGYFDNPLFLRLATPASAHRVQEVRLFVPYDAVEEWNGSTSSPGCVYSQVLEHSWYDAANGLQTAGESIDELIAGVIEARADGLTPMVTISGYPFATARPSWDQAFPDPTTVGGNWEYRCGLQGILDELSRLPTWEQPHIWEAVNEPEVFPIFHGSDAAPPTACDVGATPQPDGAAKAACIESIASAEIHGFAGHDDDTVIAGTFEYPDIDYLQGYVSELARLMPGPRFPATWSVHDYHDVTNAYTGAGPAPLAQFDAALARDTDGLARSLWITEAGTVLTSAVRAGDCPAVGVDPAGSLGACINGQPARQVAAADEFFALPGAASAVPITHLFWYQFTGAPLWDSGLVDPAGAPRVAYCIFYGSGSCPGSPDAA